MRRRRWQRRSRRWCGSTAPATPRIGGATTSPGSRTSTRRWTRSTGSSRSTWTRAARKGAWEVAGLLRASREDGRGARIADTRSGSRIGCRGIRAGASRRSRASRRGRSRWIIEAGDSGPVTPIGINLPNDQDIRETHGSKSVSLSNVAEAYEQSTPREFRREFSWSADEVARAERWGAFAARADDQPARGHRPRVGPGLAIAEGRAGEGAQGAVLGHRGGARGSRGALLRRRSVPGRARPRAAPTLAGGGPRRVRGLRAQRARAAAPDPRGLADRGRPHAQPPADRALAAGQHGGHPRSRARGQDVLPRWSMRPPSAPASAACSRRCSGSRPKATTTRRTS